MFQVRVSYFFKIYTFYVCFLVLCVLISILCVPGFCIALCIVSHHAYHYLFSICVQFYRSLSQGLHPTGVNKYHIISYQK
jgi:hypothetical protein